MQGRVRCDSALRVRVAIRPPYSLAPAECVLNPLPCSEIIIPDSEDEEEAPPPACFVSASQAVVDGMLYEAAGSGDGSGCAHGGSGDGAAAPVAAPAWLQDVVLRGPAQLTLLLPRDAAGELGLDTRCVALPRSGARGAPSCAELTAAGLLELIHSYYEEQVRADVCEPGFWVHTSTASTGRISHAPTLLPSRPSLQLHPQEQLQLLRAAAAAGGAAAVLRPAFLELAPVPRGALLAARVAFEGLRKATREPGSAVYELLLGR